MLSVQVLEIGGLPVLGARIHTPADDADSVASEHVSGSVVVDPSHQGAALLE